MKDSILEKLSLILQNAPASEAEVVYVMVEIRKFLERAGEATEAQFSTLRFFCDWIAHVELSFARARRALARLDPEIGTSGSVDPREVEPHSEIYRLMSLEPPHEEIERFCTQNDLPKRWVYDPIAWRECTRLYGYIVLNCPLSITRGDSTGRYIKQLTLANAVELHDHPDKHTFSWDWKFELSDGTTFTFPCEYSYPSPSYDPSRPTTPEFGF